MSDPARIWRQFAEADMAAAETLVRDGHYGHALVLLQQAIEKMLKGLIAEAGEEPPRIHSLVRLAELGNIGLTHGQRRLMHELANLYVLLRYPDGYAEAAGGMDEATVEEYMAASREMMAWLREQLT